MSLGLLLRLSFVVVGVGATGFLRGFGPASPWGAQQERKFPSAAGPPVLLPQHFAPLPTGSITPKGWLLKQLKLQAQGLSGHLSQFWRDVMQSVWIGGGGDGGLHERTPYWLNGIVPLAYLLRNAGEEKLAAVHESGIFLYTNPPKKRPEQSGWACKITKNLGCYHDQSPRTLSKQLHVSPANHSFCAWSCRKAGFGDDSYVGVEDGSQCWCGASVYAGAKKAAPTDCNLPCTGNPSETCGNKWRVELFQAQCQGPPTPPPSPAPPTPPPTPPTPPPPTPPTPPPPPAPSILDQARRYMEYILAHQQPDGWLGPAQTGGVDYWGRSNVLLAMLQYAEAEPARAPNVTKAMLNYMLTMKQRLANSSLQLQSWAAARWLDMAYSAHWLLEHAPQGHEQDLWELADTLHAQGLDWETWFQTFRQGANGHNVNNAQALKSAAVWYRQAKNETLHKLSLSRMAALDARNGLPTGMFIGDEIVPGHRTRDPSRGSELCGVVEAMWSYSVMFATHGDVAFADRVERIAYNALPATWASPKGGDMWAHQYLQAVNQIKAVPSSPHVWGEDGPAAMTYGLAPNYGCCTANFNQGWPKFAHNLIFTTADGGAAVGIFAPATAKLPKTATSAYESATVDVNTTYPFGDTVTITVTTAFAERKGPATTAAAAAAAATMPLYLRIPGWADKATLNGSPLPPKSNGTMHKLQAASGVSVWTIDLRPSVRMESWDFTDAAGSSSGLSYSVHRGALMYSLPLGLNFTQTRHYFEESNDYQVRPTTPWAYALVADPESPAAGLEFVPPPASQVQALDAGLEAPWNHSGWPTRIRAKVRALTPAQWGEYFVNNVTTNAALPPPASPACQGANVSKCGPTIDVELVPHGGTDLRMGELPLA